MNVVENGDPPYITSLLDQDNDFSCYFVVGDPIHGTVERIGVVAAMLMSHSMVLRRMLCLLEIEVENRWDVPLPDVQPSTFKNMLRFTYGFNNIQTYSMTEAVELLNIADRLMIQSMLHEVSKHIVNILTPNNVILALKDPVCLQVQEVKHQISNVILSDPVQSLCSQHLPVVSPTCMRYLVFLEHLPQSTVWKAVITWARNRVLKESIPVHFYRLESYRRQNLLFPPLKHMQMCSLNAIKLVEHAYSDNPETKNYPAFICAYHFFPFNLSKGMTVCTESNDVSMIHKQFVVEALQGCRWVGALTASKSELVITTRDTSIDLYSVVCTAKRCETLTKDDDGAVIREAYLNKELAETVYECELSLKTILVKESDEEELLSEITFKEEVMYGNMFKIPVFSNGGMLRLQPNSSYKIQIQYETDHPLWYTDNTEDYNSDRHKYIDINGGLLNKACNLYASHINFVLYRPVIG